MRRYWACVGAVLFGSVCAAAAQTQSVNFFPAESFSATTSSRTLELATIAVGDFNGDGNLSLVVGSTNISLDTPPVIILDNDGDGNFSIARELDVRARPGSIVVDDFDGDGNLDLAIALLASDEVAVLLGTGNGAFLNAMRYPTGNAPVHLAVGDINGDGEPDLVTANREDDTITVLINKGDGSGEFEAPFDVNVRILDGGPARSEPSGVAIGDFNGDGLGDIAVALPRRDQVAVLLNDEENGIAEITDLYDVGRSPVAIAAARINADGRVDLVVANQIGDSVNVGLGDGSGGFTFGSAISVGNGPVAVAVGDVNGDGRADILTANSEGNNVGVLAGRGDGTFESVKSFSVGGGPSALAIADLDDDGRLDVAVANRTAGAGAAADVSVLFGREATGGLDDLDDLIPDCAPACGPLGMAPVAFTLLGIGGMKRGIRRRRA